MAQGKEVALDINSELVRHLQDNNEILVASGIFASLTTNERRVAFAYDLLGENGLLPTLSLDGKSGGESEKLRMRGNQMFKEKKSREAHELYTKSATYAEPNSENLAVAYANRSAVLFENGLYQECLHDIDLALKNNYPEKLRQKLNSRQAKARELLPQQSPVEFNTPIPVIPDEHRNSSIECASDSIRIEDSASEGRHIVATRDLKPGEIIAIENPYCQVLLEQLLNHCHHCLKLCYTLIPCERCTQTLYCSDDCQKKSSVYHQYECPILLTLGKIDIDRLRTLPLKIVLSLRDRYENLDEIVLDKDGVYKSDRYDEIHNLIANTEKRSVADLFNRAVTVALIFHLIKKYTKFFEDENDGREKMFKELLLLHMQTGPCNFHEITEMKSSDNTSEQLEIGAGAYSFLSMFNHSCCPNVVRYTYGSTAIVITIGNIKKGEQCFDNYGQHHALMPRADRKAKLKKQYLFDCTCIACENDYPLYLSLAGLKNSEDVISAEDLRLLGQNDLEVAKRIFGKMLKKIKKVKKYKPTGNLQEMQEIMKQCCFIFRCIKTPI